MENLISGDLDFISDPFLTCIFSELANKLLDYSISLLN